MDCAAICLLTTAVQFLPHPNTVNCTYCVETRSTYEHCFKNVIECAYRDPSSLIICLNVFEKNYADPAIIQHTIRCVSYQDHYVSDQDIRQASSGGTCSFDHVQRCECDVCPTRTTTTKLLTTTTAIPVHRKKHHHHHHGHRGHGQGDVDTTIHPSLIFPNNSFAQQYKDSGRYLASSSTQLGFLAALIFYVSALALV